MADYFIDYDKVLADLESKRDALNAAIDGIRKLIHVNSQMLPDGTIKSAAAGQLPEAQEIQSDTFFSLSIPDAIEKFLRMMKKPQPVREIADSLERGGFSHTSQRFPKTVATTLNRMAEADEPKVVKVKGEWGLTEWYPGRKKGRALSSRRDDDTRQREDEGEDEEEATSEPLSSPIGSEQPLLQSHSAS